MSGRRLQHQIFDFIARLFASELCLACGCELSDGGSLCETCRRRLQRVPKPCHYCAEPNAACGTVCPRCLLNPPRWQKMIAPYQYRGLVRDYLLQLKYSEAIYLANSLCRYSRDAFRHSSPKPEVLLPVPMHRERLLQRGFNQADEIAACWGRALGISIDRRALQRTRHTPSQSGLTAAQRERNINKAFVYTAVRPYRHVAIIDDIVTTGSTVQEITKMLHREGVEHVEVWALARVYRR